MSGNSTNAVATTSQMALKLPGKMQAQSLDATPTAPVGDIPPTPTHTNMWARDRLCSVSSNIICPSAPTKQDPSLPRSLDATPMAPSDDMTAAAWPTDMPPNGKLRFNIDTTPTEELVTLRDMLRDITAAIMCPSAPTKQDPSLPSSLDPTPTAASGDMTPASFLPNDVFTKGKLRFSIDATAAEELAPSSDNTPANLCFRDRSCSVSSNIMCPSAPTKQDPRLPSSLDPTPTAASGEMTPASFLPNDVFTKGKLRFSIDETSTEELAPSSDDTPVNLCPRDRSCSVRSNIMCPSAPTKRDPRLPNSLDPTPTGALTLAGNITPVAFFSNQSSGLFSADETPIDAVEADATPTSFHLPSRGVSNSSLNNAHILDSAPGSFVSSADDSRKYSASSSFGGFESFSTMQDSGPPMSMRWLGC